MSSSSSAVGASAAADAPCSISGDDEILINDVAVAEVQHLHVEVPTSRVHVVSSVRRRDTRIDVDDDDSMSSSSYMESSSGSSYDEDNSSSNDVSFSEPIAIPLDIDLLGDESDDENIIYAVTTASASIAATSKNNLSSTKHSHPPPKDISPYLHHCILEGNWPAVLERLSTHPEECRFEAQRSRKTPLHEACSARPRSGNGSLNRAPANVIYALLDVNKDVASQYDVNGNAPLHLVCRSVDSWRKDPSSSSSVEEAASGQTSEQWEEVVQRLLSICPEATQCVNKDGKNPLMEACEHQHVPATVIQALLRAYEGAAAHADSFGKSALAKYGEANGTSLSVARLLLDACPESVRFTDLEGSCPLHRVSFDANVNIVESMLLRDQSVARIRNKKGLLPLHRACQSIKNGDASNTTPKLGVIQLLLEAFPDGVSSIDEKGSTPLHYSTCRHPNLDIVRCICDVDPSCLKIENKSGWTCLHNACAVQGSDDVCMYLLDLEPNLSTFRTKKGDTALHIAVEKGSAKLVQALVHLFPGAIVLRNDYGFTPLHIVSRNSEPSAEIIRILCKSNPECLTMRTHAEELPFHLICRKPNVPLQTVQFFLDEMSLEENVLTAAKNNPLHDAAFRRLPYDIIEAIALARPKWVIMPNTSGALPFHIICKVGCKDLRIFSILLKVGGKEQLMKRDSQGHTPIHSICRPDLSIDVVSLLLQSCPDAINSTTSLGELPLHLACYRGCPIESFHRIALVGAPSLIIQANKQGVTPLHALMAKHRSFVYRNHSGDLSTSRLVAQKALTHRALFLISLLLRRNADGEIFDVRRNSLMTEISLHDLMSVRQQYGWSIVEYEFLRQFLQVDHFRSVLKTSVTGRDELGNTPLHVEASVSPKDDNAEKRAYSGFKEDSLAAVLGLILDEDPSAAEIQNKNGDTPLSLLLRSKRSWDDGLSRMIQAYPKGLGIYVSSLMENETRRLLPSILEQVGNRCGLNATYGLLRSIPNALD